MCLALHTMPTILRGGRIRPATDPHGPKHDIDSNFGGADSVYSADVDGDGDMDVLGAARLADDIVWWENTAGDGSAWTEHIIDNNFNGAVSVYSTDVDGDGDMDVFGAAYDADDIVWWGEHGRRRICMDRTRH